MRMDTPVSHSGWKLGILSSEKVIGERMIRIRINRRGRSLRINSAGMNERAGPLLDRSTES